MTHVISRLQPQVAVLSYDLDEIEVVFRQKLHARYHGTDTWLLRKGGWQIVAGQMFRYYEARAGSRPSRKVSGLLRYLCTGAGGHSRYQMRGESFVEERKAAGRATSTGVPGFVFPPRGRGKDLVPHRDSQGKVDAFIDRRNNEDLLWKKQ